MPCPHCGSDKSSVKDKRPAKSDMVRRRRECKACGERFTTYEAVVVGRPKVDSGRIILRLKC